MDVKQNKILLIEDSDDLRNTLQKVFQYCGFNVESAANGQEALEKLREIDQLPCLILLDLTMPVMDGYEFRRQQELDSRIAKIPVVVMTAHGDCEESLELGARGFIRKPFELISILDTVKKYCAVV